MKTLDTISVPRCYDSHCHFIPTGQIKEGLSLFDLKDISKFKNLKIEKHYFRGDFLVGFGWDQYEFNNGVWPTKELLDQYFSDVPVVFSRVDGHTSWFNSKALLLFSQKLAGCSVGETPFGAGLQVDRSGIPTGIAIDQAKIWIDSQLPAWSPEQLTQFALSAQEYFLLRGFTHLRDMTCDENQFLALRKLDQEKRLKVFLELNFTLENMSDLQTLVKKIKAFKLVQGPHIRVLGVKVFLDGALGSDGAYLSQPYQNLKPHRGDIYWSKDQIEEILRVTWENGLEVSFHAIGDLAADVAIDCAIQVQNQCQITGVLNIEHAELLQESTILKMKQIKNLSVHIQPSHYLSDAKFLKEKLGPLSSRVFRWLELQENGINFKFGSDSPIEEPNFFQTMSGVHEAKINSIPEISNSKIISCHSHPDVNWGAGCVTEFNLTSREVKMSY